MSEAPVKTIAFYLPQFHPFKENDEWWGTGFTEWRNVARARPLFEGHEQPREPADLGFYDLRVAETRAAQAALARQYGVHGFCYYYYWFAGRKVMQRPLQEVVESGAPDFPFCICWANENWSRLWDGGNAEVLLEQAHNEQTDLAFIADVLPILKDPRYIRIDEKPLLVLYRASLLSNPRETADRWRKAALDAGLPGLHLCAVLSFDVVDPQIYGFDSAVEFPPHGFRVGDITNKIEVREPAFRGRIYDYGAVVSYAIARPKANFPVYRTVSLGWDNTARKRLDALIFHGCTPALFEAWLGSLIEQAEQNLPEGQRLVFINAWNEWAEGTYLEPDSRWGHAFLEAHARAIAGSTSSAEAALFSLGRLVQQLPPAMSDVARRHVLTVASQQERLREETELLRSKERVARLYNDMRNVPLAAHRLTTEAFPGVAWSETAKGNIESIAGIAGGGELLPVSRERGVHVKGWLFAPNLLGTRIDGGRWLILRAFAGDATYYAPLPAAVDREDVVRANPNVERKYVIRCGFDTAVDLRLLPAGAYELSMAVHVDKTGAILRSPHTIQLY